MTKADIENLALVGKWKPVANQAAPFWGMSLGIPHLFMWHEGRIVSAAKRYTKDDGIYFPDLDLAYRWCRLVN